MTRKYQNKYRKPYRIKKKKSILHSRFFWLGFFILVIFGAIFYSVLFASLFQIKEIIILGNQEVPREEVDGIIVSQITRKIIFFNSKSIFLLDSVETEKRILEKFPQIFVANVKRNFPNVLIVEIKERGPAGTWCQPCLENPQDSECFYFDEFGIIFEKNPQKLQPPIVKPENPVTDLVLGKLIIDKQYLEAILKINGELKEKLKLTIQEFIISYDVKKLTVFISEGWKIFFDLDEDISSQIFNLDLVLKEQIPSEKRKNLEYINLKFGNRVYIKYKD